MSKTVSAFLNTIVFAGLFTAVVLLIMLLTTSGRIESPKGWKEQVQRLQSGAKPEEIELFFQGSNDGILLLDEHL